MTSGYNPALAGRHDVLHSFFVRGSKHTRLKMPKRTTEEKIEFYTNKIRRIEGRSIPHRRRRIIISSSSDSSENEETTGTETAPPTPSNAVPQPELEVMETEPPPRAHAEEPPNNTEGVPVTQEQEAKIELDPEILAALGTKTGDEPQYGDNIHDSLAELWSPLLKKGLPKEDKEKLLKAYLVPKNCTLLQAPALNPEISAAIGENARIRDKKMTHIQQQLGVGITAVNRAMDVLIGPGDDKLTAIKYLSDACRILSDSHHTETEARVKLLTPSLDKTFINVIQDACRDETLFGSKLSEKIKASKAIEKQGLLIKKITPHPTPSTSAARPAPQRGNWSGPPRYSTNKAARGGARRAPPHRKPAAAPAPAQPRPPHRPQTRAQPTQQ